MKVMLNKILLLLLFSITPILGLFAKEIPLDGEWSERGLKSAISLQPIIVDQEENNLFIQSQTKRSDITIRMSNESGQIYEYNYPAPQTELIIIDLSYMDKGFYTLELTNQWGGYLLGEIEL